MWGTLCYIAVWNKLKSPTASITTFRLNERTVTWINWMQYNKVYMLTDKASAQMTATCRLIVGILLKRQNTRTAPTHNASAHKTTRVIFLLIITTRVFGRKSSHAQTRHKRDNSWFLLVFAKINPLSMTTGCLLQMLYWLKNRVNKFSHYFQTLVTNKSFKFIRKQKWNHLVKLWFHNQRWNRNKSAS